MRDTPTHLVGVDGLRGLAALWVYAHHVHVLSGGSRHLPIISNGAVAVDLFMMLSGLLMAHGFLQRPIQLGGWWKFWTRRFFRIAPVFYLLLVIALALGPWLGEARGLIAAQWPGTASSPVRYHDQSLMNLGLHLSFLYGLLPSYSFRTPLPDWSIGLEMQFYALFPLVAVTALRSRRPTALALWALVVPVAYLLMPRFLSAFPMPSFLAMKLHMFVAGMAIAAWLHAPERKLWLALATAIIVASGLATHESSLLLPTFALFTFVCWLSIAPEKNWFAIQGRRVFGLKLVVRTGDISYSLYLMHLLIVIPLAGYLSTVDSYVHLGEVSRIAVLLALSAPFVFLASAALYVLVERPGINLGKRVLASRSARQSALS